MDLVINLDGTGEKSVRVYRALREAIVDGRLPAGHRLPATRALAADLGVGRNSVATAYERLAAEGYLEARVGAGTFVAAARRERRPRRHVADPLRPRAGWTFAPLPVTGGVAAPRYDFRTGIPDARLFPFDTWRRLVAAEMRLRANSPGTYAEPSGHPALRAAIARYLGVSRSVRASGDDVLVTNGTQHALDAEGLVVAALPAHARLVYATPSHQFPLGRAMSLIRRHALLDWARRRPAAVIEDDYDSEFRFSARPLEPLYSLDTAGRVIYVGTFSKTMLPTIRTGFVLAPPGLGEALVAARQLSDGYGQVAVQAALARFIEDGQLARHIRKAREAYAERHARIAASLAADDALDVIPSAAGLHVTALLRDGGAARAGRVVAAAARRGVAVDDLAMYVQDSTTQAAGFVFGFGAVASDRIDEGLAIFARELRRAS